MIFIILHLNVSHLSMCSSCFHLYCTIWIFPVGNSGLLSPGKVICDMVPLSSQQSMVHAWCLSSSMIHWILTWTTGSLTRTQMLTHTTAHGSVQALQRVCTESWLREKSLTAPGNRTSVSGLLVWHSTSRAILTPSINWTLQRSYHEC